MYELDSVRYIVQSQWVQEALNKVLWIFRLFLDNRSLPKAQSCSSIVNKNGLRGMTE